jgi:hypothetical protein
VKNEPNTEQEDGRVKKTIKDSSENCTAMALRSTNCLCSYLLIFGYTIVVVTVLDWFAHLLRKGLIVGFVVFQVHFAEQSVGALNLEAQLKAHFDLVDAIGADELGQAVVARNLAG